MWQPGPCGAAFRGRLHLRPRDGGRADAVPDGDPAAVLRVLPGVPDGAGDRQAEEFGQKRHRGVIPIPNHLHTKRFELLRISTLNESFAPENGLFKDVRFLY